VTVGADSRCWGADADVARAWERDLAPEDREVYRASLAAVRALGSAPYGGWHGMLAWKLGAAGASARAASLRLPDLARAGD
jgi:hypothetical protein